MTEALHKRFQLLLCQLPEWDTEDRRRLLLRDILQERAVWDFRLEGSPAVVADRVIDACEEHDPESLCVLLACLREAHKTHPGRCKEIDILTSGLCVGRARRRREWSEAPYLGLTYFDRRHAPIFFGRDAVLNQLIQTLNKEQGQRFAVVVGASGSGKSSLARAGLWARLADGEMPELPGSEHWLISAMTPTDEGDPIASMWSSLRVAIGEHESLRRQYGKRELASLKECSLSILAAQLMDKLPRAARWLLILDQMEELFAAEMKEKGAAFLERLIEATQPSADGEPSRLRVVATLRADFFHHCLAHVPLKRLLDREGGTFLLGPPDRRSLEEMVSGPLTEVDLAPEHGKQSTQTLPWLLDTNLPATIAADAERHPGGLALMAFALRELYEACEPTRRMDVATYQSAAFGGLGGAIARRADATMESLAAKESLGEGAEHALTQVFVRLVNVNQEDAPTRRREPLSAWKNDPDALQVIEKFQEARLLVADRAGEVPVVEVAHEALLREWPRLASWIGERREAFQLKDRLLAEAHQWMRGDKKHHQRRPYAADLIDECRQRLDRAGLLETLFEDEAAARLLTPEVAWILNELHWPETTPIRRRDIGQRLAEINDPRPGIGVKDGVPDILWRPISGGTVTIEGSGAFEVEQFRMAAYPITFAQFGAFLYAEDGYDDKRWWRDLEQRERESSWESVLWNHPITEVSWFDATAFSRWLSIKLGLDVRLPDEQEWQWAAQSQQTDFKYPWGPDWIEGRANTRESDINRTTAVGMFPQGDSLQNISDLAGNVDEWCRNEYAKPDRIQPGGEKSRVLRGGSWYSNQDFARADYRSPFNPGARYGYVGFRVVVSSPPKR